MARDLGQSLLQSSIDLPDQSVSIDDIKSGNHTYVHGPDDQRGHDGHTGGMGHIGPAPHGASPHAGTMR